MAICIAAFVESCGRPRGVIESIGATSASLLHPSSSRMAGYNVYEIADNGQVTSVTARVFDPAVGYFSASAPFRKSPKPAGSESGTRDVHIFASRRTPELWGLGASPCDSEDTRWLALPARRFTLTA